jgi:hypothetical protein
MKAQKFYIGPESHGIVGNVEEALMAENAPEHKASDYKEVAQRVYEETVLDLRYEGGAWFQ